MADPPVINVDVDVDMSAVVGAMEQSNIDLEQELNILIITPVVQDPKLDFVETTQSRPGAANPTNDNHRFDVIVHTPDQTQLHLGQAGPADRITDTGLAGRTQTHIHWEVRGGTAPTIVSLGRGSNEASATAAEHDATVPVEDNFNGFAAVTRGDAVMSASKSVDVIAEQHDLKARSLAGNVAVQSVAKEVEVSGNKGVTVTAGHHVSLNAASAPLEPQDHNLRHTWTMALGKAAADDWVKLGLKAIDVTRAIDSLFMSFKPTEWSIDGMKKVFKTKPSEDIVKGVVDLMKLTSTVVRAVDGSDDGKVKLKADTDVSATGKRAFSAYGGLSASITSALSAGVLGTTTSIKGVTWTSVWSGLSVSIKSRMGKAKMESQSSEASVKGATGVEVSCKKGTAKFAGENAQLSASGELCAVGGPEEVKVVSGESVGYGIIINPNELKIGRIESNAGDYKAAAIKDNRRMSFTTNVIEAKVNESHMTLKHNGAVFGKGSHHIECTTNVVVRSGDKILLK